jgi:hypothetical protein
VLPAKYFLWGALTIACWVAGLFFLRFWRQSRDRFFAYFAVAFWVLALNWIGLLFIDPTNEARLYVFVIRLFAFIVIIAGIVDKNRQRDDT